MDKHFVRSSAVVGTAHLSARLLGIAFSFVVATLYAPADFGQVRYLIALAGVLAIPTIGLPRVLSRFISQKRSDDRLEVDRYYSNGLVLLAAATALVMVVALVATVLLQRLYAGLFALCFGIPIVNMYFELLRAVERYYALAFYYISANLVQLVVVVAAAKAHLYSVTLVVVAYGLSSIPPLLAVEWLRRSPVRFRAGTISRSVLRELGLFSLPMLIGHAAYTVWFNFDFLLVEHLIGLSAAGNYALSKTVTIVFLLVPYATTVVVLPRFVRGQDRTGPAYLRAMLLCSAATSAALLLLIALTGRPLLHLVFHDKYPTAWVTLTPLSIGMALYSVFLVLETWVISVGRPQFWTLSICLALGVSLVADITLIPLYGQLGAGIGFSLGSLAGLLTIACCTCTSWAGIARTRRLGIPFATSDDLA